MVLWFLLRGVSCCLTSLLVLFFFFSLVKHCDHLALGRERSPIIEQPHDKTIKVACVPSEGSDQPGHSPSLIRVFAVRMKKARVLSYLLSVQRRLWSDWADAEADLSLRWAHSHCVGFVTRRLRWSMCFTYICIFILYAYCLSCSLPLGVKTWIWFVIVALTVLCI